MALAALDRVNSVMDQQALLMILSVVIAALVSALTALGVSYFRTRGQNLATKHDFDELLNQLKANTELVETIKSEVSHRDWAQRERTTLRRTKLEALLDKMHDCEVNLDRRRHSAIEGKVMTPERDPADELRALADMFPELENEADRFISTCRTLSLLFSNVGHEALKNRNDPTARQIAYDHFESKWSHDYKDFLVTRDALRITANSLLERIIDTR